MDYNELLDEIDSWQEKYEKEIQRLTSSRYTEKEARKMWEKLAIYSLVINGFSSFVETTAKKEGSEYDYVSQTLPVVQSVKEYKDYVFSLAMKEKMQSLYDERTLEIKRRKGIISAGTRVELLKDIKNRVSSWKQANEYMFTTSDKEGKSIRIRGEVHANTLAETVKSNARLDAQEKFIIDSGSDIARIPTNSSTKDKCLGFQGKLVSISGKTKKIMYNNKVIDVLSLPELRTRKYHIFHPHCHHFDIRPIYDYKTIT